MTIDTIPAAGSALAVPSIGDVTSDALNRLREWVEAASNAHQLVAPLVSTPFVPDAYRPKVDPRATPEEKQAAVGQAVANATAAVLYGLSLGVDPLMALQQIYVVHGRPGMYAKMMVALVQSRGHEVWTEDLTDTRAVVAGRRRGSTHIERVTITMDQARRAKWTSNSKYAETPQDMLWARAAGRVCDRIASDVLKGIPTVEQIEDETVSATATVGPRTVTPRKAAPAAIAAAEEPPLDIEAQDSPGGGTFVARPAAEPEPVDLGDAPASAEPLITEPMNKKLHVLLGKTGRGEREAGLKYLSLFLRRTVESTKDLTKREAKDAIDDLEEQVKGAQEEPALEPDGGDWPAVAQPPLEP